MTSRFKIISEQVIQNSRDLEKKANKLLHVFLCGSYQKEDLKILEEFKAKQHEKGIEGVFLMKDIEPDQDLLFHEKFEQIWKMMNSGDNIPVIILFAGESATQSQGLNAEIQTVASHTGKRECAHLFKMPGIHLVDHQMDLHYVYEIKSKEEFFREADRVVQSYFRRAKVFYQYREGQND
jgi:hypothetical protein